MTKFNKCYLLTISIASTNSGWLLAPLFIIVDIDIIFSHNRHTHLPIMLAMMTHPYSPYPRHGLLVVNVVGIEELELEQQQQQQHGRDVWAQFPIEW